jgi:hypothetical protein
MPKTLPKPKQSQDSHAHTQRRQTFQVSSGEDERKSFWRSFLLSFQVFVGIVQGLRHVDYFEFYRTNIWWKLWKFLPEKLKASGKNSA